MSSYNLFLGFWYSVILFFTRFDVKKYTEKKNWKPKSTENTVSFKYEQQHNKTNLNVFRDGDT